MATSNKNERAWTPQEVKALDCAMINELEIGITSIDQAEIPNPNKLPLEALPTDFWGRKLESEKSILTNSSILTKKRLPKQRTMIKRSHSPFSSSTLTLSAKKPS